jgi:hypothetical protein
MRTQFVPYVRLISLIAGGLVSTAGCDNTTAGQAGDPPGPVRLSRVLIQDGASTGAARKFAVDLFEKDPKISCHDDGDCTPEFAVQGSYPGASCSSQTGGGFCKDPLVVPVAGVPIEGQQSSAMPVGGIAIRLVFNKLLQDSTIQTKGTFNDKIAALIGPDGMTEVPSDKYWDQAGSPDYTSDVIKSPFGPAIVLKPKVPLSPNQPYTIRLHPATLVDREGNSPVDTQGAALKEPTSFPFMTEKFAYNSKKSYPTSFTGDTVAEVAPNEVVQIGFWEQIKATASSDPSAVAITLTSTNLDGTPSGFDATKLIAYIDNGDPTASPSTCSNAASKGKQDTTGFVLNLFPGTQGVWDPAGGQYTTAPTYAAAGWPPGIYTFTFSASISPGSGALVPPASWSFKVPSDTTDPLSATQDPKKDSHTIDHHPPACP